MLLLQEGLSPTGLDCMKTRSPGLKTRPDKDWVQFLSISKTNRCHAKVINVQVPEKEGLFTIPTLFTHKLQLAKTLPPQLLKAGLHLPSKTTTCQTFPNSILIPMVKPKTHKPNSHPSVFPSIDPIFRIQKLASRTSLWDLHWRRFRTLSSSTDFSHVSKSLLPDRADWVRSMVRRDFTATRSLEAVERCKEIQ